MKCEGENLVFYESPSAKRFCLANELTLLGQNLQPFFSFKDLYMEPAGVFLFFVCVCVSALHFLSVVPEFRNNRLQLTGLRRRINKGQRQKYFLRLFFFPSPLSS